MPPRNAPKASAPPKKSKWKDSTVPKQPLTTQERLKRLFTSLCAQIDGGYFGNAVKTCDKILRLDSKDVDARQTKLFLLLQTEQYNEALTLIDSDDDPDHHAYERAYSMYRLQRESDAKEILESIKADKGEDDRGIMHLEAQLNYREGLYQEAFDLYNQLLDTAEPNSEEHSDILTNLQASQKHLDFIERGYLHALDALPTSVTSALESAPPPIQPLSGAGAAAASALAKSSTEQKETPKVKKTRQSRIPAGVIPGVTPPPDPERWIKKSERSSFGQGRRRRGQGGGGGGATQGSSSIDAAHTSSGATPSSKSGGGKKKKK